MKICIHSPGSSDITIPFPNAMLFSSTLLNILIKSVSSNADRKMPELPPETTKQICTVLKEYSRHHGPLELVQVDSADGDRIIITI